MVDDYDMIRTTSLLMILFSVIIIALAIIFVHTMPGKIAHSRNHPQAEAIEITSLLGLLIFPLWMFALIWAYIKFPQPTLLSQNHIENAEQESLALADKEAPHSMQEQAPSEEPMTQVDSTLDKPLEVSKSTESSNESATESNTKG